MYKKVPYQKRYWVYLAIVLLSCCLLIANIFRTDDWTGDKPFSEFTQQDWRLFFVFIAEELIICGVMVLFTVLGTKSSRKHDELVAEQFDLMKLFGIEPGVYDYVWFDWGLSERALIAKKGDQFRLYVQKFDEQTDNWITCNGVSVFDSLEAVKKELFYEYEFFCEENTQLDKYGEEFYKEN